MLLGLYQKTRINLLFKTASVLLYAILASVCDENVINEDSRSPSTPTWNSKKKNSNIVFCYKIYFFKNIYKSYNSDLKEAVTAELLNIFIYGK